MKKIILFALSLIFFTPFVYSVDLTQYCSDGYYKIPGEEVCSRAPGCKSGPEWDYDALNKADKMPNPQKCMGDGAGREDQGCAGYVPVCCYEMARTGDYTKCIGYWERLWCAESQCAEARSNGASDSQCGGSCQCAHAFTSYCGNKSPVPIEQRLGQNPASPTPRTPTSVPTLKPTTKPSPTATAPTRVPSQRVPSPTRLLNPTPTTQKLPPTPTIIRNIFFKPVPKVTNLVPTVAPYIIEQGATPSSPIRTILRTTAPKVDTTLLIGTEVVARVTTWDQWLEVWIESLFDRLLTQ